MITDNNKCNGWTNWATWVFIATVSNVEKLYNIWTDDLKVARGLNDPVIYLKYRWLNFIVNNMFSWVKDMSFLIDTYTKDGKIDYTELDNINWTEIYETEIKDE